MYHSPRSCATRCLRRDFLLAGPQTIPLAVSLYRSGSLCSTVSYCFPGNVILPLPFGNEGRRGRNGAVQRICHPCRSKCSLFALFVMATLVFYFYPHKKEYPTWWPKRALAFLRIVVMGIIWVVAHKLIVGLSFLFY